MKIAIVGTGISGLTVAHQLHLDHDITVFEKNDYIGGHTHTIDVNVDQRDYAIDIGFIVFNRKTYPEFCSLIDELDAATKPSSMGFSVSSESGDFEYSGSNINTLFAQRKHLVSPRFHRLWWDILRFNRCAPALLHDPQGDWTLKQYLSRHGYSDWFINRYIVPMGAAIWSMDPNQMLSFPARFFVRFFLNHGLLQVSDRPQWYVIDGGSKQYANKLVTPFRDRIQLNNGVRAIERLDGTVKIESEQAVEQFDAVFIAAHSDEALRMLRDPSNDERDVLSAMPYQVNDVVLHTDASVLPKRKSTWSAWNYHWLPQQDRVALTYNMNILQSIESDTTFCVSLNYSDHIDPDQILYRCDCYHPVITPHSVQAQARHHEISGTNHTYYCGAYWRYGFHEDGLWSGLQALQQFNENIQQQSSIVGSAQPMAMTGHG